MAEDVLPRLAQIRVCLLRGLRGHFRHTDRGKRPFLRGSGGSPGAGDAASGRRALASATDAVDCHDSPKAAPPGAAPDRTAPCSVRPAACEAVLDLHQAGRGRTAAQDGTGQVPASAQGAGAAPPGQGRPRPGSRRLDLAVIHRARDHAGPGGRAVGGPRALGGGAGTMPGARSASGPDTLASMSGHVALAGRQVRCQALAAGSPAVF